MVIIKNPPTKIEIEEMQKFYDEGNSLQKVADKFQWRKQTLIKYIQTRKPSHISEEEFKRRRVKAVTNWRRRVKIKLVEYKGGKCKICGYNRCLSALDFHHRDPKKKKFIVNGNLNKSFEILKKETDKCELVCRNCHAEVHEGLIKF